MRSLYYSLFHLEKPHLFSNGWRILPLLALLLLLAHPHPAAAQRGSIRNATIVWSLSEGTVVDIGKTVNLKQGTMTHDYTIEAKAVSPDTSLMTEGVFRAALSIFSPSRDMGGQKAGTWYVRGRWSLTDIEAPQDNRTRHLPGVMGGQLQMELPFDPTLQPNDWSATLRIPQATFDSINPENGRQPLRGDGSLSFDNNLNGELTLNLKLWPQI